MNLLFICRQTNRAKHNLCVGFELLMWLIPSHGNALEIMKGKIG